MVSGTRDNTRDFKQRQHGRRREPHKVRENPKGPLRMTGWKGVNVLRSVQSRLQGFVPLDQWSGNETSGSIHFKITMENNRIQVIRLTAQSQSAYKYAIAHAWNGCSQSSCFPTAGQEERSSGNEIMLGPDVSWAHFALSENVRFRFRLLCCVGAK